MEWKRIKTLLKPRLFVVVPLFVFGIPYYLGADLRHMQSASALTVPTSSRIAAQVPVSPSAVPTPTSTPLPTATPYPTPVPPTPTPATGSDARPGAARKVEGSQYGYTMDVKDDDSMATPVEIFDALNRYRASKGVPGLAWDGTLAAFAQERADYFQSSSLDEHKGFLDYASNQENRKKLGFWALGENASKGYTLTGTHLIEWVFAGDAPHDENQLRSGWTSVGVGVRGSSVDLVFGGSKM